MVSAGVASRTPTSVDEQLGQSATFGQITVSTTPTLIAASAVDRQSVRVQNRSPDTSVYVGFDNTVSAASGVEVSPGSEYVSDTFAGDIYVVAASGTVDIRYQEVTEG